MAKLGDLFFDLLGKAGVDLKDERLKSVFSVDVDIDDEFAGPIQKNLFNLEAAKGKVELKNHFVKQAYQGIDQNIQEFLNTVEGGSELLDKISDIKSTGARLKAILPELIKKSSTEETGNEGGKLKALQDQNKALNEQILNSKAEYEAEKNSILTGFEREKIQDAVMGEFNAQRWSDAYAAEDRPILVKSKIDRFLADKKAELKKGENGEIQFISIETGTPVHDEKNNLVTLKGFVDKTMVLSGYLKVADASGPNGTNQNRFTPISEGTVKPLSRVQSQIEKSLEDQFQFEN